jgi:DNA replicative helicase MCM subunit Mcm2 (Cdc46/Mcm family)
VTAEAYCPDCGARLVLEFDPRTGFERVACDVCQWAEEDFGVHFSEDDFVRDVEEQFPKGRISEGVEEA